MDRICVGLLGGTGIGFVFRLFGTEVVLIGIGVIFKSQLRFDFVFLTGIHFVLYYKIFVINSKLT